MRQVKQQAWRKWNGRRAGDVVSEELQAIQKGLKLIVGV